VSAPQPTPPLLSWAAVRAAFDTPWKARSEIERLLLLPLAWLSAVGAGVGWGAGWKCYGLPIWQLHRRSRVQIGSRLQLRSSRRSNPLGPNRPCIVSTRTAAAELTIGDDFGMTGGSVVCALRIEIGHRVTVGCNTIITDTDFHPLDPAERREHFLDGAVAPVVIEDDVFIGMNALILKGVRLGTGCVIGAGSVVTRDVPPGAVAAGNPAQIVRTPHSTSGGESGTH
jgi:acetyltransferase-like isoleucine patch superfamily enzyme